MDRQRIIKKIIAVLISLALVILLLSQIHLGDVIASFSAINPVFIIIGFVVYICSFYINALRFHFLLRKEVKVSDLFNIVCVHTFMNNLLPARTGEVSYIYLIKKVCRISTGEGIASLATARIFDFLILSIFFLFSIVFLENIPAQISYILLIIQILLIILIITLLLFLYFDEQFLQILYHFIGRFRLDRYKKVQYLTRIADETIQSYKVMKTHHILWNTLATTIGEWLVMYLLYGIFLYSFNIRIPLPAIILIVSVSAVLPLLPIYAIGGFGTTELTVTAFLIAFGVSSETAIVVSFGTHILGLIYCSLTGIYGMWKINFKAL
jgi:glycosyltransferase 2 family protein